ncbi:hypothetical protein MBLNU230_g7130t1 [Neophaeotheca triangularis]
MNGNPPTYDMAEDSGSKSSGHRQRHSTNRMSNGGGRMQAERNGAMPMPVSAAPQRHMAPGEMGPIAGPRSPPKNKNTSHVPCKFFFQGACQAGRMCPFSHDAESSARPAPCKYFAKGHCKFGRKCALLHVAPNGHVVNRGPPAFANAQPYANGPSNQPGAFAQPPPGLLSMQVRDPSMVDRRQADGPLDDFTNYQYAPRNGFDGPQNEANYATASSAYGSPHQSDRFATSPPRTRGLSVLEAPLPSSFDSQGISMAARDGPFAASMPSHFGPVDSPPSSLPRNAQLGSTMLSSLQKSAFGNRSNLDGVLAGLGSSPPSGADEPLTFPKRSLHSERLRPQRHQMVSASLGAMPPPESFDDYSDDEERDADREEDLLPSSLHELLPESKSRRSSRNRRDNDDTPAAFLAAQRRTISGHNTPQDGYKMASSPSRYTSVWSRNAASKTSDSTLGDGGMTSPSFSHVGSPLRNSSDFPFTTTSTASSTTQRPSLSNSVPSAPDNPLTSPTVASPPRQASMSMLTQELQRTKLDAARSAQHPVASSPQNTSSNSSINHPNASSRSDTARKSTDRGIATGRERIAEEDQELFSMDEVSGGGGGGEGSLPRSIPSGNGFGNGGSAAWGNGSSVGIPKGESPLGAIGGQRGK